MQPSRRASPPQSAAGRHWLRCVAYCGQRLFAATAFAVSVCLLWWQVLGKQHVIKSLDKCDFTPIYDHLMAERDKKKAMSKEVGRKRAAAASGAVPAGAAGAAEQSN